MNHPLLYEINTRCWLRELSERAGAAIHLGNVPDAELDSFTRHGFTHIWLMGVWQTAQPAREHALRDPRLRALYDEVLPDWTPEDVAGSPYAIGDYHVPPQLGGNNGPADFRRRLNARGIRLILDFVPNHLGLGHHWLRTQPELFVHAPPDSAEAFPAPSGQTDYWIAHGKDPYFPAWTDTAQLDYRRPQTHAAMLGELLRIADRCDGVRCDMAMLALRDVFEETWQAHPCPEPRERREFWQHAIAAVRQRHPEFLFIAEAYWDLEPRLIELGFDYAYNKWLYDHLRNDNGAEAVRQLNRDNGKLTVRGAHFLENHDEPRAAQTFALPEHRTAAVLTFTLPGMRLIHEGQLNGATIQLPVQLARRPVEPRNDTIFAFYTWLLRLLRATAIGHGEFRILRTLPAWSGNESHRNLFVIQWRREPGRFEIVVVNPTEDDAQCFVHPEVPELHRHQWRMSDLLGAGSFDRFGIELRHKGLYLALTPRAAHVYHFATND